MRAQGGGGLRTPARGCGSGVRFVLRGGRTWVESLVVDGIRAIKYFEGANEANRRKSFYDLEIFVKKNITRRIGQIGLSQKLVRRSSAIDCKELRNVIALFSKVQQLAMLKYLRGEIFRDGTTIREELRAARAAFLQIQQRRRPRTARAKLA